MNYLLYYIIFGFLGIIIEFIYMAKYNILHSDKIIKNVKFPICGDTLIQYFNICIPFLNIYGLGGLFLAINANKYYEWNYIKFAIFMGIFLTIMECIIGNISYKVNGQKQWNYKSSYCNGFISFEVFMYWIICSYIFRWIYYYIEDK
jgi:hypothetical protein